MCVCACVFVLAGAYICMTCVLRPAGHDLERVPHNNVHVCYFSGQGHDHLALCSILTSIVC